ncbi:MAG: glycosyltransferase [Rhodocyclaceae bacterium]
MRLLLVTDQSPESQHSAIRGIFDRHLRQHAQVDIVWFSRSQSRIERRPGHIILPWRYRRRSLWWRLHPPVTVDDYDVVIVRNLFPVLSALQDEKRPYHLGFWESFPHRFRRLYEAELEGKARWRKSLEYRWHARKERRLLSRCDFYLPITAYFQKQFRPDIVMPTHPLPMGVNDLALPAPRLLERPLHQPMRLLYVGAVDVLRDFETILAGIRQARTPLVLDIYTPSDNPTVRRLKQQADPMVRLHSPLPREALLERMSEYDLGISLIPVTPLYAVASPTKTMEYFAMGLPALMTRLPEHEALFGELPFLFADFSAAAIADTIECLAALPENGWRAARAAGRDRVLSQRSYRVLTTQLIRFLEKELPCH